MARVYTWSPTVMREREEAFAALVDRTVLAVSKKAAHTLAADQVVVAAGAPVIEAVPPPPVSLGSVAAVTGMWNGAVTAELMPALTDTYLQAAATVWTGASDAFPDIALPMISDSFAEDYLARAKNRLVGIGDVVWQNIREQLLVGFGLGESTQKLAARVVTAGNVSVPRANVIARTEVNAAANMGGFQQVQLMGMTGTKEWLDTNDERTRCTHRAAGGQIVPLDGRFRLGGDLDCGKFGTSFLLVPGDPIAPIGETIQCRCSVAYDLELIDESVVTAAAGEVNTGGMIALMPTADDANRMVLDVDGAEPATELHATLLFLGEASEWGAENRRLLTDVVDEITQKYVAVQTETFSVNVFNPSSDDFDTAVVLGVRGSNLLIALHKAISTNVTDIFDDEVPEQHEPWVPHITLAYSDDMSVVKQAMKKLGPVTFDRIRVVFAGQITDYPLPLVSPEDAALVASDRIGEGYGHWDESKVKRNRKGEFAKKASSKLFDLAKIWSDFSDGRYRKGEVIATGETHGKKVRLIAGHDAGISEEYQTPSGSWVESDYWVTEKAFTESNLTGYGPSDVNSGHTDTGGKKDLDAVPPAFTTEGHKTKYSDPAGVPGLLVLSKDPGKSGDGWTTKADGKPGPWGRYGAAGVILRHRGEDGVDRFLFVQRGKGLDHAGQWQLAGGGLDSNETPLEGAAREIVEELGFSAEDVAKGRVHGFHEVEVPLKNGKNWKYTSIAATVPDQLVPDLSGENAQFETADAKWLTIDEIQALDDKGKLLGPLAKGQWKENMIDLFPPDAAPVVPEVKPSIPKMSDAPDALHDFSKLKKIGGSKGSNPGGTYEAPDGSRWYVKAQKDTAHAENERVAAALYREAGIDVPEVIVGGGAKDLGSGPQTATRIVEGTKTELATKLKDQDYLAKIREGFAVDAWLGNYDAVGLALDNIVTDANGNPVRIDVGGALEYRAQGKAKGHLFGTSVTDWDELRTGGTSVLAPSQAQATKVFKGITPEQLSTSVDRVEKITPEKIREIVKDKALADKLIARRQDLLDRAKKEGVLASTAEDLGFQFVDTSVPELNPATSSTPAVAATPSSVKMPGELVDVVDQQLTPTQIWSNAQNGDYAPGQVIAQGTHKRLVVNAGPDGSYTIAEEFKSPTGWEQTGSWDSESEFVDTVDLPTYKGGYHILESKVQEGSDVTDLGQPVIAPASVSIADENVAKAWDNLFAFNDNEVIAKGMSGDGHKLRIVVATDFMTGQSYLIQEKQFPDGSWSVISEWKTKDEFTAANLGAYPKFKGHTPTPGSTATSTSTGVVAPSTGTSAGSAATWADIQSGKLKNGNVLAQTTDADGNHWRLVVVGKGKTPRSKAVVKEQKAGKFADLSSPTAWTTHDFISDDASFADVLDTKYSASPTTSTPPTPAVTAPAGSHLELWQKMITDQFGDQEVVGEYISSVGTHHTLVTGTKGATPGFIHYRKDKYGKSNIVATYTSEAEFLAADLAKFKTPKPKGPAPKTIPKLTNAVIYGKYSEGEVIATYAGSADIDFPVRIIYKDGKIVQQAKLSGDDSDPWKTYQTHGKGAAYKFYNDPKAKTFTGSWILGEPVDVGGKQLVTDAPVIAAPPTPAPIPLAPMTFNKQFSIKLTFKKHVVKWHTAAPTMLEALVKAQKDNPDLTLGQILKVMDGTTTTQTDPSPFTTKISKYLSTTKGKQHAKILGLPSDAMVKTGITSGTSKPGTSTPKPSTPSVPFVPVAVDPNASHTILEPGSHSYQAPPGGYKIHSNSEMSKIQAEMHTKYGAWTSAQQGALKKYTGSSYHDMNGCLRKPSKCTPAIIKNNQDAMAGMRPLTTAIRVTRGSGWGAIPGISSKSGLSDAEKIKQLQSAVGKLVREPGFTSTSSAATPAFGGPLRFVFDVPAGTPAAWVKNISHYNSENELLLAPGMKYRIKKVTPGTGGYYSPTVVEVEVVYP